MKPIHSSLHLIKDLPKAVYQACRLTTYSHRRALIMQPYPRRATRQCQQLAPGTALAVPNAHLTQVGVLQQAPHPVITG